MQTLQNQVAIVTGGGEGIGKGIAKVLAREGASVVLAEKNPATGRTAEEEIRQAGGTALFLQTDTVSEASIREMVAQALAQYGQIDTLVNNAGITRFKPLLEASCDDWDEVINTNLRGYFLCSKAVAPAMIARGRGSIVHISSNHAFATVAHAEMYAASKGGINAMTRAMALSLGEYGIRVNAICPGFTATERHVRWMQNQEDRQKRLENMHALKRISQPEDIGQLALYLASDAARTMTGAELLIDAGLSIRLYNEE